MEKLRVGFIGLGRRGAGLIEAVVLGIDKVRITYICDLDEKKINDAKEKIKEKYNEYPKGTTDYREVVNSDDVDAVVVATSWEAHVKIALYSMKKGKPVAIEVGGTYSLDQCWELVKTYEETKTKFMMLENCCFGKRELQVLNMVRQGVFGEVVHAEGGYCHDIRDALVNRPHYRLMEYLKRNCENYPTHELGPIAQVLDINHGNRMVSLTATSSKARGLHEFVRSRNGEDHPLMKKEVKQGDIITTVIKCANGETIIMRLDTTLPRYYSRDFTIRGTKGMYEESSDSVYIDNQDEEFDYKWKEKWGNAEEYYEKYKHPIWREYEKQGIVGTHDGMDYLVFNAFFDSVINNTPVPIDVYDTVSWMSITPLSDKSIALGSAPVEIPDFTNGKWVNAKPLEL